MSAESTIRALRSFCVESTGNEYTWNGNTGTYKWTLGKTASNGVVNGVVRKIAGTDVSGEKIWVVAGSLKIMPTGEIARFTGLTKKMQSEVISSARDLESTSDEIDYAMAL